MSTPRPNRPWRRLVASIAVAVVLGTLVPTGQVGTPAAAAGGRQFGARPLDDVLHWAAQERRCGLTTNRLAAMMLAPTYPETGAPLGATPSPMTLSRWDNQRGLHSFGTVAGQERAFWHPGIGPWQFDSAGLGAPFTAAQRIDTYAMSAQVAATMAQRWCAGRSLAYVWAPWYGCGNSACRRIYDAIYRPGTDRLVGVAADAAVGRRGGMTRHTCSGPGRSGTFTCWRVDPARAKGHRSFAAAGFGPAPITAAFYVYAAGGREYRHWLRADTGYRRGVWASRPLGANARTSITWQRGEPLTVVRPSTAGSPSPPSTRRYPDVPTGAAYEAALDWAVGERVVSLADDRRFHPTRPLTRGDAVIWVWRGMGRPATTGQSSLSDVPARTPLARAVNWARGAGVVTGFADGTFRPERRLTRSAFVRFVWKAHGRPLVPGRPPAFADVPRRSPNRPAVAWAARRDYLVGVAGDRLEPRRPVTRRLALRWLHATRQGEAG